MGKGSQNLHERTDPEKIDQNWEPALGKPKVRGHYKKTAAEILAEWEERRPPEEDSAGDYDPED